MVKFMATRFLLLITNLSAGYLVFMVMFPSLTQADQHELIFMIDNTTEMSGSITLQCRDDLAEPLEINQIKFWLNRTSACDLDLREREDVRVIRVTDKSIKLNISRNLEGNYTCGQLIAQDDRIIGVEESNPVTLVSLQTIVPVPSSVQTTFTARVGNTAVLQCPIAPGALLQYYSVMWTKDSTLIAKRGNSQDVMYTDPERYDIDYAYSLLIHSVNVNDSSSNYQCVLFITNPHTDTKQEVQPYPNREIPLTLNIIDEEIIVSTLKPTSRVVRSPTEQPSFTCIANAPNITWTYINSGGEETNLIEDGAEYQIVSNVSDGNSTTKSTITFLELNLATDDSAIVRCKVCNSLGIVAAEPNGFFVITADYSFPDEATTRCHCQDYAFFIGFIAACVCVALISAISFGIMIVVCCYRLKVLKRYSVS